jgi:ferredoxin
MKVGVIAGKCVGHARCAAVAPDIYVLDDDGYLNAEEIAVAPGNEALARRGARACPERAIRIFDEQDAKGTGKGNG